MHFERQTKTIQGVYNDSLARRLTINFLTPGNGWPIHLKFGYADKYKYLHRQDIYKLMGFSAGCTKMCHVGKLIILKEGYLRNSQCKDAVLEGKETFLSPDTGSARPRRLHKWTLLLY